MKVLWISFKNKLRFSTLINRGVCITYIKRYLISSIYFKAPWWHHYYIFQIKLLACETASSSSTYLAEERRSVSNTDLLRNITTFYFYALIWSAQYLKRKCYCSSFRPNSAIQAHKTWLSHRPTAAILLCVDSFNPRPRFKSSLYYRTE